jgi:hypothetical protein
MELNLKADIIVEVEILNFRNIDWEEFHKELSAQLVNLPPPTLIDNQRQMDSSCDSLTKAIQCTINS